VRPFYLEYLGDHLELPLGETVVGRDVGCMLRFNDPAVSRRHVRFLRRADEILVEDLHSSNGTLINGERLRGARQLREGDVISVGSRELTLRTADGHASRASTLVFAEDGAIASRRSRTAQMAATVPPPYRSDRRRFPRHSVELTVQYVSRELELEALSHDLSTRGVFVRTQVLDPIGTPCQLILEVEGRAPLALDGVVRRVVEQPTEGEHVGLGVEFVAMKHTELQWLDVIIDRAIDAQLPAIPVPL